MSLPHEVPLASLLILCGSIQLYRVLVLHFPDSSPVFVRQSHQAPTLRQKHFWSSQVRSTGGKAVVRVRRPVRPNKIVDIDAYMMMRSKCVFGI